MLWFLLLPLDIGQEPAESISAEHVEECVILRNECMETEQGYQLIEFACSPHSCMISQKYLYMILLFSTRIQYIIGK